MRQPLLSFKSAAASRPSRVRGFTLIEVMIVVAIVAILSAIAIPSYKDYILRGKLVDANTMLSSGRANMERWFQDNRTYVGGPCTSGSNSNFALTCSVAPTTLVYTLQAAGIGATNGFVYTIDQAGTQATTTLGAGWAGAPLTGCWIMRKGQTTC